MSLDPNPDDPTVIRTRTQAAAPPPARHSEDTLALPIGTRIGEFELTHRIGEGGFGIVYRAWDHSLERDVALKEYLPSSIATRVGATRISCRSDRHRETFEAGLKSFINEAKLLARFDHPSLVKVFRFWEANGTAYMVMPFYEGTTMRDTVRGMGQPPDETWIMELLAALTEALEVIHREQCFHRDIAPDNVMLLAGSGRPLLLDFGAARRVIGDMTQALTVILKPGYAPVEQYAEVPGMKQGAWTDVYALAAVVYWTITGKTPPPSVGRMLADSWVPLAEAAAGRYSAPFLEAIDRALAVRPEQRTPDIATLRDELGLGPIAGASPAATRPVDPDATVIRTRGAVTAHGATAALPTAARTAPRTAAPPATVARPTMAAPPPPRTAMPASLTPADAAPAEAPARTGLK
ncbi:MAG: serine/threonine protein kinase [Piscinibacter sp.]|nr:serine/threonine protein kinase [Piscinibacter sp.]